MPARPYRSRLLAFLDRRFARAGDRAVIAVRQVQVTATWGLQLLSLPVYVLVQAARPVLRLPHSRPTGGTVAPSAAARPSRDRTPSDSAPGGWLSWMERGPLARRLDWFGEARRAPTENPDPALTARLDRTLARLETALGVERAPTAPPVTDNAGDRDPFTIAALLRAAVQYFFGRSGASRFPEPPRVSPPDASPDSASLPDPWLSWDDLYAPTATISATVAAEPPRHPSRTSPIAPVPAAKPDAAIATPDAPAPETPAPAPVASSAETTPVAPLAVSPPTALAPSAHSLAAPSLAAPAAPHSTLDATATPAGYDPHWLERVLNGLDRLLSRLEAAIAWLWRQIRQRFWEAR